MVHATPAVQNGLAFIAGCDSMLRAIRIADGKEVYQIESGAYTGASPLIDGSRAYFGTFNNEVLAFDLERKRRIWRYAPEDGGFPFYSSAAISNGRVILGGRDKFVHAIDAKTGKADWTFATRARVDSSPVIAGGRVYVGSSDGRLYVLDLETRQEAVRVRRRVGAHDIAGRRRRPPRHRIAGRRHLRAGLEAPVVSRLALFTRV